MDTTRRTMPAERRERRERIALGSTCNRTSTDAFRPALRQANFYTEWKGKFGDEARAARATSVGKLG